MGDFQKRAERLAKQFDEKARKPLVIEFAGVPKAGKTTTLSHVQTFLKRSGFRTDVVVERASVCPIRDKKHANFNIWTACTTLAQILDKTQEPPRADDPQILFLNRGLFDSICWLTMMEQISRLRSSEREIIQRFLTIDDFRIYCLDTSRKREQKSTAETVVDCILGLIEEQIAENILSCSKEVVTGLFEGRNFIDNSKAHELVRYFAECDDSNFLIRDEVENDASRVQALPVVVVRNANGDVLRLRRHEKKNSNPLHEKLVIWAGGHVRCEDAVNGTPLVSCAVRELEEELRLQVDPSSIKLIGAVYFDSGGSTSKHVAIVYEWRAPKDEVAVVLSRTEFFERRGTSLSGSFASAAELAKDVEKKKLKEPWSVELVREYLAKDKFSADPRLF